MVTFKFFQIEFLLIFLSFRIAADLNLKDYVQHYWRDFPTACHLEVENAKTHQITPDVLQNLISKTGLPEVVPPSIVKTLHTILKSKTLSEPFPIVADVTSRTQDVVLVFALFTSNGSILTMSMEFDKNFSK